MKLQDTNYILRLVKKMMTESGLNQKSFARKLHISPQYLNDVVSGKREPGFAFLQPLGFERVLRYRKIPAPKKDVGDE